jgi:hypothetical protein
LWKSTITLEQVIVKASRVEMGTNSSTQLGFIRTNHFCLRNLSRLKSREIRRARRRNEAVAHRVHERARNPTLNELSNDGFPMGILIKIAKGNSRKFLFFRFLVLRTTTRSDFRVSSNARVRARCTSGRSLGGNPRILTSSDRIRRGR